MYILIPFRTCFGWMGVVGSTRGLKKIIFPKESRESVIDLATVEYPVTCSISTDYLRDLPERLTSYLEGKQINFFDVLDMTGSTAFQRKVWEAARKIPYGETTSYGFLARSIGHVGGARAVGHALGKNPFPIVVPCHRIIGKNGDLTGFAGGLELKESLLKLEKSSN
jgi:O-6-methylguanine DNA methyltransferase